MAETIRLCSSFEMDIVKTFECGQCFRWNADENGVYRGIAYSYPAKLWQNEDGVFIRSDAPCSLWHNYFDLSTDYDAVSRSFMLNEYISECTAFGRGIRILRQEPWEALCSFIISQCNNIGRIKGIVERLCALYGEESLLDGEVYRCFPKHELISALSVEALSELRCGYRAPYIISAAKAISSSELDLEALKHCDYKSAKNEIMKLNGVGSKVADCVVLFGLGHMEAFPIDVWIKRVLAEHFPKDFDPASLGSYAGLAQQYMFYHARSNSGSRKKSKQE